MLKAKPRFDKGGTQIQQAYLILDSNVMLSNINPIASAQNAQIRSSGCLEEHRNLLVNQEWLTDALCLIQTTLLNPYVNVAMQILANMSRKVAVLLETNE